MKESRKQIKIKNKILVVKHKNRCYNKIIESKEEGKTMIAIEKYEFLDSYFNEIGEKNLLEALDCITAINGLNDQTIDDFLYWLDSTNFDSYYMEITGETIS